MDVLKRRSSEFSRQVLCNGAFVAMAVLYVVGKVTSNLLVGARPATAVRSGIMGLALYVFGALVIHLLSVDRAVRVSDRDAALSGQPNTGVTSGTKSIPSVSSAADVRTALAILGLIGVVLTWNALHSVGAVGSGVPVWNGIKAAWEEWVRGLVASTANIEGTGLIGFPNLVLYVALPAFVYAVRGRPLPKVGGLRSAVPSLPFVALYIAAFCVIRGISARSLLTLLFVMFWPALGEEFLYRGILQKALGDSFGNAVTGIVAVSFLFAASHIPAYVIAGSGPVVLRWSGLLSVMLTSFFWGYGYHRTGALWPWIFIHAASNLVGF